MAGLFEAQQTRVGRPVHRGESGEPYSEKTVTFPLDGKWVTFPSVLDRKGTISTEDAVLDYVRKNGPIDPITGEKFPLFDGREDAEAYARERSPSLLPNDQGAPPIMENPAIGGGTTSLFEPFGSISGGAPVAKAQSARVPAVQGDFGYPIRTDLYPGEDKYFAANPTVAGMAAADDAVILNPYSTLESHERDAVISNEAARLHMQRSESGPQFEVTPKQTSLFTGTPYESNGRALRETIAARIYSDDPFIASPTKEQRQYVDRVLFGRGM